MAMVVKNNMSAVRTLNTLNTNSSALQKSLAKVSSGMKINSAQDDASGYAISERMRVQIRSLDQANQNTQNASSLMKTAEGAVSSTVEILKTLKEKAINAATDTNTDSDRATIQKELDQFIDQIDDNALTTFNSKYLVDGSKAQEGQATYTAMTNQSLSKNTSGTTRLVDLKNRNDESLEIKDTDYVTASFVKDGKTYTTKFGVEAKTTLEDVFKNLNAIKDEEGNAIEAFGPAQTSTTKMSVTDATTLLGNIAGDSNVAARLFEVANGTAPTGIMLADGTTAATAEDVKSAITTLKKEDNKTDADILQTLGVSGTVTSFEDAKNALETAIQGAYESIDGIKASEGSGNLAMVAANSSATVEVKADNLYQADGTADANATVYTATAGATTQVNVTAGGSVTFDGTTANTTLSVSKNASAYAAAVMESVENVAKLNAAGTAGAPSIEDAVTDGTTLTVGNVDSAGVTVTGTGTLTWSAETTAGTAVSAATAKDYAIAYAYNSMGGGGELVNNSTAIGLKTSGDLQSTADGEKGLTVTANKPGVQNQISGLTISITDSEGNVKKSANAALDAFKTQVYAKNKSANNEMTFHTGAAANQAITVGLDDMRAEALGLKGADGSKVSVATQDKANAAVAVFDNAIQKVLDQQATIGAVESRLEYTSQNLTTSSENVQAAESTIRDADMAKEMTTYTKNNVLLQAAQSMLAQANQNSSAVLSLLQ